MMSMVATSGGMTTQQSGKASLLRARSGGWIRAGRIQQDLSANDVTFQLLNVKEVHRGAYMCRFTYFID